MRVSYLITIIGCIVSSFVSLSLARDSNGEQATEFFRKFPSDNGAGHTNNWAVLVSTSRFWFNYRHMANVLSMYRTVKRLGIPDSQIILMLSDDVACNPRNAFPGTVYNNADRALDLYGENIEVDYRGYDVTVENFLRLLTNRWDDDVPRSKRLLTDERSNIFIYMTGHGGDEFLKFQDAEEIGSFDIADAFGQMWEKRRYNEIFFMIDTCQANTMYTKFYSPNILAVGSSAKDQSSYSHHADSDVGVAVIDRFTYYNLEFLESIDMNSDKTLYDLFASYNSDDIHSHPGFRTDLYPRSLDQVKITEFFGNVQKAQIDQVEDNILELVGKRVLAIADENIEQKDDFEKLPVNDSTEYKYEPKTSINGPVLLQEVSSKWNVWLAVVAVAALVASSSKL
ncbi:hypothetical protein NADFUDRAFT_48730 [Nadsonia fulvescens var. elongata DSM 6958]|uniref:GPI-anchor transamidase n=1 Tax=Nadsonia fulvescens var. elongata DSM 6958 TaxID=857566 RepID=A0A1E3PT17_9ASCO|nr:hypothetical protein NADFUDRAFT_48730 [Nadsonia fulvescens var. elongata DSM 6958]